MTTDTDPLDPPLLKLLNIRLAVKTSSSVHPFTIWWRKTPHRDIIWLLGDKEKQGDSLDISWVGVLTITLSLVVNKEVIIFTMIPSCFKLEVKYLDMVC